MNGIEQQFIMDLQHHAALQPGLTHLPVDIDHGHFYDVGGGSLDRGIDRGPFRKRPHGGIAGADVGEVAAASEQRFDIAVFACRSYGIVNERADCGERGEIVVDKFLRFRPGNSKPLRQSE